MRIVMLVMVMVWLMGCASVGPSMVFEDDTVRIYKVCRSNPGNWTHTCDQVVVRK